MDFYDVENPKKKIHSELYDFELHVHPSHNFTGTYTESDYSGYGEPQWPETSSIENFESDLFGGFSRPNIEEKIEPEEYINQYLKKKEGKPIFKVVRNAKRKRPKDEMKRKREVAKLREQEKRDASYRLMGGGLDNTRHGTNYQEIPDKKLRKKLRNRETAMISRVKKKLVFFFLKYENKMLKKIINDLNEEIHGLKKNLKALKEENSFDETISTSSNSGTMGTVRGALGNNKMGLVTGFFLAMSVFMIISIFSPGFQSTLFMTDPAKYCAKLKNESEFHILNEQNIAALRNEPYRNSSNLLTPLNEYRDIQTKMAGEPDKMPSNFMKKPHTANISKFGESFEDSGKEKRGFNHEAPAMDLAAKDLILEDENPAATDQQKIPPSEYRVNLMGDSVNKNVINHQMINKKGKLSKSQYKPDNEISSSSPISLVSSPISLVSSPLSSVEGKPYSASIPGLSHSFLISNSDEGSYNPEGNNAKMVTHYMACDLKALLDITYKLEGEFLAELGNRKNLSHSDISTEDLCQETITQITLMIEKGECAEADKYINKKNSYISPHHRAFLQIKLKKCLITFDRPAYEKKTSASSKAELHSNPINEALDCEVAFLDHMNLEEYELAEKQLERSLRLKKNIFEKDHVELGTTYFYYGWLNIKLGNLTEAEMYLNSSHGIYKKHFTHDANQKSLSLYNKFSHLYLESGELEKAYEYNKKAEQISKRIYDPKGVRMLEVLYTFAKIHSAEKDEKKLMEALELEEKILTHRSKNGFSLMKISSSFHSLANIYNSLGKLENARSQLLFARVLSEIYTRIHLNSESARRVGVKKYFKFSEELAAIYISTLKYEEACRSLKEGQEFLREIDPKGVKKKSVRLTSLLEEIEAKYKACPI